MPLARLAALALCLIPAAALAATVKLTVQEPSGVARKGWPVTSGIPFAQGALRDHMASALFGPDGKEMPLQTEVLAKWPDGSARWLLLDFQVDLAANEKKALTLRHGAGVRRAAVDKPVQARKDDTVFRIDTGRVRIWLNAQDFGLLDRVREPQPSPQ